MPEIRINILKNEIRKNLPKLDIDQNDLYIHIRAGNIFSNDINRFYSQPPLCFYQNILYNYKFRNIYIITLKNNNPVINKLLSEFQNIVLTTNSLDVDISILLNAYNLVGSASSFLYTSIILNDNLKNFFDYDILRKSEKFGHLHYDIYEYPRHFTIHKMYPSENYKSEMFEWRKDENQLKLMIEEKCSNNFTIIKPNI